MGQNLDIYISVVGGNELKGGIGLVMYNNVGDLVDSYTVTCHKQSDSAELELVALVEALDYAQDGEVIYSTSSFCVRGYNEWLDNWKSKGWRKADGKPVAYRSFWQLIDKLRQEKFVEVVHCAKTQYQMQEAKQMAKKIE